MAAADTNVIVRILTRDDERQAAIADEFIENGAWVSVLVLAEAIWVFETVYNRSHADLAAGVEMLLSHRSLSLEAPETVIAALHLFRSKPSLGFTNCLILELARKAGQLPLGTFDRGLAKVQGTQRL